MSSLLYSLMFAAGITGFVYVKLGRRTGNADVKSSVTVSVLFGAGAFFVFYSLFHWILHG